MRTSVVQNMVFHQQTSENLQISKLSLNSPDIQLCTKLKSICCVFLCLIVNAMNTSQGKLNLHFSISTMERNIHSEFIYNINISESCNYFAQKKVISCQYNKRLLRLGVPSQLEKLIMYLECFVYLMFMCVFAFMWRHMSVAVQTFRYQFLPFTIQFMGVDFYVRFDSK